MKVLIVHAHPEPQSFSSAMKNAAVDEMEKLGHQVKTSDLYALQFNPVASPADFGTRANPDYCIYALEQRHGAQTKTLSHDIQIELEKLLWCDLLILNFPIFWFSTPAILKGWIDRVLVSGIVYGGKRFYDRGGLKGKSALVSTTLGGQAHMFGQDGIHGPLDDMLKHLLQGTLAYTGMKVYQPFICWHVPYITNEARKKILEDWRDKLRTITDGPTINYPSLDDFDGQLYPLEKQSKF